jgi:hypothetical protein
VGINSEMNIVRERNSLNRFIDKIKGFILSSKGIILIDLKKSRLISFSLFFKLRVKNFDFVIIS